VGNLLLCPALRVSEPYYVEALGICLYSAEELSYYIYHYLQLIEQDFLDERLFLFIGRDLKMPGLENKLRKWSAQSDLEELLLVILQDTHYYSPAELTDFRDRLNARKKAPHSRRLRDKADCLCGLKRYYDALHLYDSILAEKREDAPDQKMKGELWFNKAAAYAGLFAYDKAAACYEKAWDLLHSELALRRLFEIRLMDPLADVNRELMESIPSETRALWQEEFEEKKKQARFRGKALDAAAWQDKDNLRRASGMRALVRTWKMEYSKNQI